MLFVTLFCVMLCYVMLHHVMSCYVMSCFIVWEKGIELVCGCSQSNQNLSTLCAYFEGEGCSKLYVCKIIKLKKKICSKLLHRLKKKWDGMLPLYLTSRYCILQTDIVSVSISKKKWQTNGWIWITCCQKPVSWQFGLVDLQYWRKFIDFRQGGISLLVAVFHEGKI